jgi:predicted RNA-binding Zn ribbon-like protein
MVIMTRTPHLERTETRDGFRFHGGHLALDLAATLAGRLKDQPKELLASPEDLDRWLVSSGLATTPPHASARDLDLAHTLREAIYRVACDGKARAARDRLNSIATMPSAAPQLSSSGTLIHKGSASELIATIARGAVELFGGYDAHRIRTCEGDRCALLFLDLSRSGRRRWCSMDGCGNRAKAEAFRRRSRVT